MSEEPREVEHTSVEDEHTWTEQIEIVRAERKAEEPPNSQER